MRQIDIDQLAAAIDGGAVVVDVREPGEYAAGRVPGARNIPMGHLPSRLGELDPRGRCTSCAPAATAARP